MLRQDMELTLRVDPYHPTDPHYVWIEWGRDQLGYVPAEHSEHIRLLLKEGAKLRCRAARVNPTASLVEVLQVEVSLIPPLEEDARGAEGVEDEGGADEGAGAKV